MQNNKSKSQDVAFRKCTACRENWGPVPLMETMWGHGKSNALGQVRISMAFGAGIRAPRLEYDRAEYDRLECDGLEDEVTLLSQTIGCAPSPLGPAVVPGWAGSPHEPRSLPLPCSLPGKKALTPHCARLSLTRLLLTHVSRVSWPAQCEGTHVPLCASPSTLVGCMAHRGFVLGVASGHWVVPGLLGTKHRQLRPRRAKIFRCALVRGLEEQTRHPVLVGNGHPEGGLAEGGGQAMDLVVSSLSPPPPPPPQSPAAAEGAIQGRARPPEVQGGSCRLHPGPVHPGPGSERVPSQRPAPVEVQARAGRPTRCCCRLSRDRGVRTCGMAGRYAELSGTPWCSPPQAGGAPPTPNANPSPPPSLRFTLSLTPPLSISVSRSVFLSFSAALLSLSRSLSSCPCLCLCVLWHWNVQPKPLCQTGGGGVLVRRAVEAQLGGGEGREPRI